MSGGSLDYFFGRVTDVASDIRSRGRDNPLHVAFADHLDKVAKALHDLEWVWSFDYSKGDEEEAIRAVIDPASELEAATAMARAVHEALGRALVAP